MANGTQTGNSGNNASLPNHYSSELWKWGTISSGETTLLDEEQSAFNTWLKDDDIFWDNEQDFEDDISLQNRFFKYVGDHIRSVPSYTYILRYLLLRYRLGLNSSDRRGLFQYIDGRKWRNTTPKNLIRLFVQLHEKLGAAAGSQDPVLTKTDYNDIISAVSARLRTEYPDNLIQRRLGQHGRWTTYFNEILKDFNIQKLRDLALALNWKWEEYAIVKKKALRLREINYLDREDVLMYLTLQYAPVCKLPCYKAYCILENLYPEYANGMTPGQAQLLLDPNDPDSSVRMGEFLNNTLLTGGGTLSPHYRNTLFVAEDNSLAQIFRNLQLLRAAKVSRSVMEVLKEEWAALTPVLLKEENHEEESDRHNRHKLFRYLYGEKVEIQINTPHTRWIRDLPDSQMFLLAPHIYGNSPVKKYFLDSKEFLDSRLRDSYFYSANFTKNEATQRNLLLTVLFLRSLPDLQKILSYEERVETFDNNSIELLEECGFVSLYSGYAYDAFLKLLLSCKDPDGLFKFIWHVKTGSYVPGKSGGTI